MATRRRAKSVKPSPGDPSSGGVSDIQPLLKDMFACLLMLGGVGPHAVASIVAMNKNRVTELSKQLSRKARGKE